jgi:hypothetical protein
MTMSKNENTCGMLAPDELIGESGHNQNRPCLPINAYRKPFAMLWMMWAAPQMSIDFS